MFIASWNSPPKSLFSYGKLTLRKGFYNEKAGLISQYSVSKDRDRPTQLSARGGWTWVRGNIGLVRNVYVVS